MSEPPHILHTHRLKIKPLTQELAGALLDYYARNREHLRRWEPEREEMFYTLAHQQRIVQRSIDEALGGTSVRFAASLEGNSDIIGCANLLNMRRGAAQSAVLGYSVDAPLQGRGYATEMAAAVIRYAFDVLNLHRVEATYQPNNEQTGRVLRKLSFAVEGYARDYLFIDGKWRDAILASVINSAWRD